MIANTPIATRNKITFSPIEFLLFLIIAHSLISCNVSVLSLMKSIIYTSTQTTRIYASPSIEMLKAATENNSVDISETAEWLDNEEELARLCGIR